MAEFSDESGWIPKIETIKRPVHYVALQGGPSAIGVDFDKHRTYVANFRDNTVSVIDTQNNTRIGKDIPVGNGPHYILMMS